MSKKETVEVEDEPVETPEPIEDAGPDLEAAPEVEEDTEPEEKAGNAEAAKWRTKLRETESERDALNDQVESLRRSVVDTQLSTVHHVKSEGFWASGVTVGELLDDAGNIDGDKVGHAVTEAKRTLGLQVTGGPRSPSEGNYSRPPEPKQDWGDAFSLK